MPVNILIASDHAGYEMKQYICNNSINKDYNIIDLGTHSNSSVDYPDFATSLCNSLKDKNNINPFEITFGVLLCCSGIGMSITANRYSWIRAPYVLINHLWNYLENIMMLMYWFFLQDLLIRMMH